MKDIVAELWRYCHVLRHDGVDYSDYIEQISYLLFLKMASEQKIELPRQVHWYDVRAASPTRLVDMYSQALEEMGERSDTLGEIFRGAENRISTPSSLARLATMIDETDWSALGIDVQASVFEGLLERAAAEGKKGAGQYFTPRPLVECMVNCVQPDLTSRLGYTVIDPACGTGGFLAAAHEWFLSHGSSAINAATIARLSNAAYFGVDLVARPRRLALMNMYLRGVDAHIVLGDSIYSPFNGTEYDLVLTNPPFGSHGVRGVPAREDFAVKTSNKQINFIQHAVTLLKPHGTAAIVVPDNVLFSSQGTETLRVIAERSNLHTIMRCPNGTFSPYTQGTKTNVIFIAKGTPTKATWIYDARTGVPLVSRRNPLTRAHFADFEQCFGSGGALGDHRSEQDSVEGRWRCFSVDTLDSYGFRIDSLRWLSGESDGPSTEVEPLDFVAEAIAGLARATEKLLELQELLRENMSR